MDTEKTAKPKVYEVTLRNGKKGIFNSQLIHERLESLAYGLNRDFVKIKHIVKEVTKSIYNGITTAELDTLCAETAAYMNILHPHYSLLAARLSISNLHEETKDDFAEHITDLYEYIDNTGKCALF